jgi:glycosyltransferase involved in cell wall biosynthesis
LAPRGDALMPLFSVVIPVRNRRALLADALESVRRQRLTDYEVIVVDDGSTDGTAEYVRSLGDRIKLIEGPHQGPGAARNTGAAAATGEYLAFLDSDDVWLPWTLSTFADAIARHDRPALVCGSFHQFSLRSDVEDVPERAAEAEFFADYLTTWPRQLIVGAGMIAVARQQFDRVGGFVSEPINAEDHDLTLKLGTAAGFVQIVQPLTLAWRLHSASVTRDRARSVAGCLWLIESERAGRYPGGAGRAAARRGMITTHARAVSLECAREGRARDAARLYGATAAWHVRQMRWRYLLSLPVLIAAAALTPRTASA